MDISLIAGLKDRDLAAEGVCVGEGRFVVERMLLSGLEPLALASVPRMAEGLAELGTDSLPLTILPQPEIAAVAGYPFHRGVIGAFRRPPLVSPGEFALPAAPRLLVLDGVTDPVNVGGIIRSAAAFAVDAVLLGTRCGDPYSRRGIRASMATCFSLPLVDARDPDRVKSLVRRPGLPVVGAALDDGAVAPETLDCAAGLVLVLGNEGHGISAAWRELCDRYVRIPVSSRVDSLNVGAAAAVLLYELARLP